MSLISEKTEKEALSVLLENVKKDELSGKLLLSDEFLAEFAGVNKADFNRRADQLVKEGLPLFIDKLTTAELNNIGLLREKITRYYLLRQVILILSQYKNKHQIKAVNICDLALEKMFESEKQENSKKRLKVSTIRCPIYTKDLFGQMYQSGTETKRISELSLAEYLEAKAIHLLATIGGLQKELKRVTDDLNALHKTALENHYCDICVA